MITDKVLKILQSNADKLEVKSDNMFQLNIPQEVTNSDETIILVTEIHDIYTNRASNESQSKEQQIEIQVFYRGDTSDDILIRALNKILEQHWFYQIDSYPAIDEVTGDLSRTLKYQHTEVI